MSGVGADVGTLFSSAQHVQPGLHATSAPGTDTNPDGHCGSPTHDAENSTLQTARMHTAGVGCGVGCGVGDAVGDEVGTHSGLFKYTKRHSSPNSVTKHSRRVHGSASCTHAKSHDFKPGSLLSSSSSSSSSLRCPCPWPCPCPCPWPR